jgi:hypothetical protein
MPIQLRPKHPLLMKKASQRNVVARRIRRLTEEDMRALGNWSDVEGVGQRASLNSIDLDDEEIFEPKKGEFECLATLYVTLSWPDSPEFEETFVATIRGTIADDVKIGSIQIDTSSLTGEPEGARNNG